jgi:4-hydroxybenzoate polyprenyltransferase
MLPLLSLIRFPNLLIILATQYLLRQFVLAPALQRAAFAPSFDELRFFLLTLCTVMLAAGSYVINDVLDAEPDRINKPDKVYVGKIFSRMQAMAIYRTTLYCGLGLAIYLAVYIKNFPLVLIYPAAAVMLWFYSFRLKKMPLAGNMVVSLFCAFVPGIVWFAEREVLAQLAGRHAESALSVNHLFAWYLTFAFCSTMFREIVKDIEDLEGDRSANLKTLPVVAGVRAAKGIAALAASFLLITLAYFLFQMPGEHLSTASLLFALAGIILPLLLALVFLIKAEKKEQFSRISLMAKGIMAAGLVLLLLLQWKI